MSMRKLISAVVFLAVCAASYVMAPETAQATLRAMGNAINQASVAITGGTINGTTMGATTPSTVSVTTLVASSTITPSATAGIVGTTTNNNANAGSIGEVITATVATPGATLTNVTPANVTSISLSGGDWDVSSTCNFALAGVTGTNFRCGISTVSATLPTQPGGSGIGTDPLTVVPLITTLITDTFSQTVPPVRVQTTGATTIFLIAQEGFTVGAATVFGTIRARRMR